MYSIVKHCSKRTGFSLALLLVFLLLSGFLLVACSSSRYYIQPANENYKSKEVAVLKLPNLHKIAIDDNVVTGFDQIFMMPGWHHISFGWQQNKGCAKWQYIKHYYRGPGGSKIPISPYSYESSRCIKTRLEDVNFSGWWAFSAGDRIDWVDICEKLTTTQSPRDEVDDLADTYQNGNPESRLAAVKRLGNIQNVRVVYILINALKDNEVSIKIEACKGLKKIDNQYAVSFIKELRANTKNSDVKSATNDALKSLTGYDIYY